MYSDFDVSPINRQINQRQKRLLFEIEDSGIGIKQEDKCKLFKLFGKLDDKKNMNSNGVGLGLTICQKLSQQLGGVINFASEYGIGTRFWFTVPCEKNDPLKAIKEVSEGDFLLSESKKNFVKAKKTNHSANKDRAKSYLDIRTDYFQIKKEEEVKDIYFEQEINEANEEQKINLIRAMDSAAAYSTCINSNNLDIVSKNAMRLKAIGEDSESSLKKIFIEEEEKESKDTRAGGSFERMQPRVLIVDDSPFNLMTLSALMRQNYGIKCDEASNGEIAINKIIEADQDNSPYKIVFLDCNMPVLDGFEATKRLKHLMLRQEICYVPIIALTALVSNDDKKRCLAVGMDQYLSKPVLLKDLKDMLILYKILNTESESEEDQL